MRVAAWFQLLTLERPFTANNPEQLYDAIRTGKLSHEKLESAPYAAPLKVLATEAALFCPHPEYRIPMTGLLEALEPMVDPTHDPTVGTLSE